MPIFIFVPRSLNLLANTSGNRNGNSLTYIWAVIDL